MFTKILFSTIKHIMSSYHQTFFLIAGKSWEITFVPLVKTNPRSTSG